MRPTLRVLLVVCLVALPLLAAPGGSQTTTKDVLVQGIESTGQLLNITVASYGRTITIRSASIAVDGTLVSNEVGGVSLTYGRSGVLAFRLTSPVEEADLHVTYDWYTGDTTKSNNQTTRLNLRDYINVRPIDATIGDDGTVTITLKNFGDGRADGFLASLQDDSGEMIGAPYYREVDAIDGRGIAKVTFTLIQSADEPVLVLDAGGITRTHALYFRAGTGAEGVASGIVMSADLSSLSGTPGATLRYSLTIKNTGAERTIALATAGLPAGHVTSFSVDGTGVQTLRLDSGSTRTVVLSVTLPAASGTARTSIPFEVQANASGDNGTHLASLPLEITPSGAASLSLSGRNWFTSLEPGSKQTLTVGVRNDGSAAAHGVELSATAPSGWDVRFDPRLIDEIPPGEEAEVKVAMRAPDDAADGRYVVDVGAGSSFAVARERSLTVEIRDSGAAAWPWLLAVAAVAGGAAWLMIRIKRR